MYYYFQIRFQDNAIIYIVRVKKSQINNLEAKEKVARAMLKQFKKKNLTIQEFIFTDDMAQFTIV